MNGRGVLLVVAAFLVLVSTLPTGGVSTARVGRDVGAAVVADERADFGVGAHDRTVTAGPPESVALLHLENNLGRRLAPVDVGVAGDAPTPPVLPGQDSPDSLRPGERGWVTATVNCDDGPGNPATETWTVSVAASGRDVRVDLHRTVAVTCTNRTTPTPPAVPASPASTPAADAAGRTATVTDGPTSETPTAAAGTAGGAPTAAGGSAGRTTTPDTRATEGTPAAGTATPPAEQSG